MSYMTLCVSQSCTRANSSHEAHDFGDVISKALWVSSVCIFLRSSLSLYLLGSYHCWHFQINDSEDSAALEPCMTILRNLSSSLYGDMKTETQVEFIFPQLTGLSI